MVKNALQSLWVDRCDVFKHVEFKKPNKSTGHREEMILSDVKCRVSFGTSGAAVNTGGASSVDQAVKLFVSPAVSIPAGSKITVKRDGKSVDYKLSGEPARYDYHQEINLVLFDGWA